MRKIPISQGLFALVDDEDYPFLMRLKWNADDNKKGSFNVGTVISLEKVHKIPMWCFLIESKIQRRMIFLDRNPLNNQKNNLYQGTPSEFCIHQPKPQGEKRIPSSQYKGVCYRPSQNAAGKYEAIIQKEGRVWRRKFYNELDAARWYDEKAQELYGDIAYKNNV